MVSQQLPTSSSWTELKLLTILANNKTHNTMCQSKMTPVTNTINQLYSAVAQCKTMLTMTDGIDDSIDYIHRHIMTIRNRLNIKDDSICTVPRLLSHQTTT